MLAALAISDAKTLYTAWAHQMGIDTAYERLSAKELRAWFDVVELATDGESLHGVGKASRYYPDLTCTVCGEVLQCPACDTWPIPFCVGESQ